jgi:ATP-binding protein involved in chromosome partitioning
MEDEPAKHDLNDSQKLLTIRMGKVKHKIAVISGKGGVGKSVVTVNLAMAFAQRSDVAPASPRCWA